jgi:uncharacterized membrane protein YkvA (DUF1232 family)
LPPSRADLAEAARRLKREVRALYLAYRDPRVPWYARLFAALVVAYALSPIDLIPDLIPILGYLDDLILIPLGVWLALRMIPREVMAECRARAQMEQETGAPVSWAGAAVIVLLWAIVVALLIAWATQWLKRRQFET